MAVGAVVERSRALSYLRSKEDLLKAIELLGAEGQSAGRRAKKLREVAGFCDVIVGYARRFLADKPALRIVEFSCGKSYLGIALSLFLREVESRRAELVGVDVNSRLVEKCRRIAGSVGLAGAVFVAGRTLDFHSELEFDLAVALHACDTATDEAIAKGIELGAPLILAVPCCQNQIRGQIKAGHPLTAMTEFGPIRYHLANLLTDALRAQYLHGAGYHVEMLEIVSPRLTPKNLCICARKVRRRTRGGRTAGYEALKSFFRVTPKLEQFCPGVVSEPGDRRP